MRIHERRVDQRSNEALLRRSDRLRGRSRLDRKSVEMLQALLRDRAELAGVRPYLKLLLDASTESSP